jgi:hypothetical protein
MKMQGWLELYLHAFLTSALDGSERSDSRPGHLTPEQKSPDYPLNRIWIGPTSDLAAVAKEKNLFLAPAGNRTSVGQQIADVRILTGEGKVVPVLK